MFGKRDSTTVLPDKPAGAPAPAAAEAKPAAPAASRIEAYLAGHIGWGGCPPT